jgi:hypothetical protein
VACKQCDCANQSRFNGENRDPLSRTRRLGQTIGDGFLEALGLFALASRSSWFPNANCDFLKRTCLLHAAWKGARFVNV